MKKIQNQFIDKAVLSVVCSDTVRCIESTKNIAYLGGRIVVCIHDKEDNKPTLTFENPSVKRLIDFNEQGFGIFETANAFFATEDELGKSGGKTKRQSEFLSRLLEVYADLDIAKEKDNLLLPENEREERKSKLKQAIDEYCPASFYVLTKNGLQPHWKINEPKIDEFTQKKYQNVIRGIIEWSKEYGNMGDPVYDTARVLRMPGFLHQKGNPYQVTREPGNDKIYTLDELKDYFWIVDDDRINESIPTRNSNIDISHLDIERVVIDVWKEKGVKANFDQAGHLWVDGKKTATFKGRKGNGNYIATTSSDYPAKGNATTYVAETLGVSTHEAYTWLCDKYGIGQNHALDFETPEPVTAYELANQEFPPERWTIDQLVPENQITIISGAPGCLKSMSTLEWSIKVALGEPAYDHFTTLKSAVWYINEDGNHKRLFHDRIRLLSEVWPPDVFFWNNVGFKLQENWVDALLAKAKSRNVGLVIFDSLRAIVHRGWDEMNPSDIRHAVRLMKPLITAGMTVLIIHHDRKRDHSNRGYFSKDITDIGEMMSGSADIRAAVDCHISLRHCPGSEKDPEHIIVTQTKCRDGVIKPFRVLVKRGKSNGKDSLNLSFDGMAMPKAAAVTQGTTKEAILEFLSKSDDKYVYREIIVKAKLGGMGTRTIEKALLSLEHEDKKIAAKKGKYLGKSGREAGRKYYFINAK